MKRKGYRELFGLSSHEIATKGVLGEEIPLDTVGREPDGDGFRLTIDVDMGVDELERTWSDFQRGLRHGVVVRFNVRCPLCDGGRKHVPNDCPTCGTYQGCPHCGGAEFVDVVKTVGVVERAPSESRDDDKPPVH